MLSRRLLASYSVAEPRLHQCHPPTQAAASLFLRLGLLQCLKTLAGRQLGLSSDGRLWRVSCKWQYTPVPFTWPRLYLFSSLHSNSSLPTRGNVWPLWSSHTGLLGDWWKRMSHFYLSHCRRWVSARILGSLGYLKQTSGVWQSSQSPRKVSP